MCGDAEDWSDVHTHVWVGELCGCFCEAAYFEELTGRRTLQPTYVSRMPPRCVVVLETIDGYKLQSPFNGNGWAFIHAISGLYYVIPPTLSSVNPSLPLVAELISPLPVRQPDLKRWNEGTAESAPNAPCTIRKIGDAGVLPPNPSIINCVYWRCDRYGILCARTKDHHSVTSYTQLPESIHHTYQLYRTSQN